jgi:hypothetical protein
MAQVPPETSVTVAAETVQTGAVLQRIFFIGNSAGEGCSNAFSGGDSRA